MVQTGLMEAVEVSFRFVLLYSLYSSSGIKLGLGDSLIKKAHINLYRQKEKMNLENPI